MLDTDYTHYMFFCVEAPLPTTQSGVMCQYLGTWRSGTRAPASTPAPARPSWVALGHQGDPVWVTLGEGMGWGNGGTGRGGANGEDHGFVYGGVAALNTGWNGSMWIQK